jgi:MarR family transcriptional regulator, lower aerobic nicotinate degradation pathway regulator
LAWLLLALGDYRWCLQLLSQALAAAGSSGYYYRLFAALEEFGPASQAVLGRRTSIDAATWHHHPAGTEQLRLLDRVLAGVQDELLAPMSATERTQLTRLLTRILEHHTTP